MKKNRHIAQQIKVISPAIAWEQKMPAVFGTAFLRRAVNTNGAENSTELPLGHTSHIPFLLPRFQNFER